jgi:cell wall-associated NlpC family hydrolase
MTLAVVLAGGPAAQAQPLSNAQIEAKALRQAWTRAETREALAAEARARVERTLRAGVVAFARRQIGKPYVWGATGPRGFDCSGLMLAAYRSVGIRIPRTTFALLAGLRSPRHLQPGDLVFGIPHHVAMYVGHGQVIHAPEPGRRVELASTAWHTGYAARTVFGPTR